MAIKRANYYEKVGDYRGAIKIDSQWVGVACMPCIREMYPELFNIRWQGGPSKGIQKAMENMQISCNGHIVHNGILEGRK
jgi:hypothetical protein